MVEEAVTNLIAAAHAIHISQPKGSQCVNSATLLSKPLEPSYKQAESDQFRDDFRVLDWGEGPFELSQGVKPKMGRIFWLGMHKILKRTELNRLRRLGFEVFNPPYISPIYDQSADRRLDFDQPTTLPTEIFNKLMRHDFFYTEVPPSIAEILNAYFDCVIVTINSDWLKSILNAFSGQVVYRIYGQHFSLSERIVEIGLWDTLMSRDGFSIVPFAEESVEREQRWFLDLCSHIVPYQIPDDVFAISNTWATQMHRPEIATSIPNIQNPYFAAAYAEFSGRYPQRVFRIYGPQRAAPPDSRIVGELERAEFLNRLAEASGFFYNYKDRVCYLPPIEMMQLGGPVIYVPGSLLSRFSGNRRPGLASDPIEAEKKLKWLIGGDRVFAGEVIEAQEVVRRRYDRELVAPVFDAAFSELLKATQPAPGLMNRSGPYLHSRIPAAPACGTTHSVVIPLHVDGLFGYENGRAYAFEGIPRVIDVVVDALIKYSTVNVIISCTVGSLPAFHDFFRAHIRSGRLSLYVVNAEASSTDWGNSFQRLLFIQALNERTDVVSVLVPHYYLFPEFLLCSAPLALYLPDYLPYLMPNDVFDVSAEKDEENKRVGVAIAKKARAILTNSDFTKRYLPDAGFVTTEEANKIVVAPLPFLGSKRAAVLDENEERDLRNRIGDRQFLFYPTANRPNKQISFLLRLFARLRITRPNLSLALTCNLGSVPAAAQTADQYGLLDQIIFFSRVGETTLRWLYENAAALCLTSTIEGNFPPQVLEALNYRAPVVATRLPTILDVLGDLSQYLLLCRPLDLTDFEEKLDIALENRAKVIGSQARILQYLQSWNSESVLFSCISKALFSVRENGCGLG
jgi:glycosyltransferase involved in cell wall biosynthesis